MRARWKETLLAGLGLALLLWMIERIGAGRLARSLQDFGMGPTVLLIALYGAFQVSFAAAWFQLLHAQLSTLTFRDIFLAYAAGDAVNMTVPSGNLAGEPVKVMLLRDKVPLEAAIASVTVYKFSDIASMTLFLLCGWTAHFWFYPLPRLWDIGAGVVIGGMAALCLGLYFLQRRGLYHPAARWLKAWGLGRWIVEQLESAHLIDAGIRAFYSDHAPRFFASLLFNLLAWFGGVVEILLFAKISGLRLGFWAALTIETFTMLINNLIFFIPGRLGVGEGSRVLLFTTLGYSSAAGLSYGILRRIRELSWIGFGFLLLLFRKAPPLQPTA